MGKQGKARAKERREKRLQEISDLRKLPIDPSHRWWSSATVAAVTGANRGIGFEIARQLAEHGLTVIVASRDPVQGRAAADGLREQGLSVDSCQLDVSDAASVGSFAEWVVDKYGGLDILRLGDATLIEQLLRDECLSEELIDGMVTKFLEHTKQGSLESNEWPQVYTDYSISKLAVNAYTRLMARTLSRRPEGHKIYINCYCPGWVKTAMTGWLGNMSAEEGADTGVWVVLQSSELAMGKFFAERRQISF